MKLCVCIHLFLSVSLSKPHRKVRSEAVLPVIVTQEKSASQRSCEIKREIRDCLSRTFPPTLKHLTFTHLSFLLLPFPPPFSLLLPPFCHADTQETSAVVLSITLLAPCVSLHAVSWTHTRLTLQTHEKMTLFNKQATQCVRVRKLLVAPLILLPLKTHKKEKNCLRVWMSSLRVIHLPGAHTHTHTLTHRLILSPLRYTLHLPTWTGCCVKWLNERTLTVASVPQTCICVYILLMCVSLHTHTHTKLSYIKMDCREKHTFISKAERFYKTWMIA